MNSSYVQLSDIRATAKSEKINLWAIVHSIKQRSCDSAVVVLTDTSGKYVMCYIDVGRSLLEQKEARTLDEHLHVGSIVRLHRCQVTEENAGFVIRLKSSYCNGSLVIFDRASSNIEKFCYANFKSYSVNDEDQTMLANLTEWAERIQTNKGSTTIDQQMTTLSRFTPRSFRNICVQIIRVFSTKRNDTCMLRCWDGTPLHPEMVRKIGPDNLTLSLIPEEDIKSSSTAYEEELNEASQGRCVDIACYAYTNEIYSAEVGSYVMLFNVDYRKSSYFDGAFLKFSSDRYGRSKFVVVVNPDVDSFASEVKNRVEALLDAYRTQRPQQANMESGVPDSRPDTQLTDLSTVSLYNAMLGNDLSASQNLPKSTPAYIANASADANIEDTLQESLIYHEAPEDPNQITEPMDESIPIAALNQINIKEETAATRYSSPKKSTGVVLSEPATVLSNRSIVSAANAGKIIGVSLLQPKITSPPALNTRSNAKIVTAKATDGLLEEDEATLSPHLQKIIQAENVTERKRTTTEREIHSPSKSTMLHPSPKTSSKEKATEKRQSATEIDIPEHNEDTRLCSPMQKMAKKQTLNLPGDIVPKDTPNKGLLDGESLETQVLCSINESRALKLHSKLGLSDQPTWDQEARSILGMAVGESVWLSSWTRPAMDLLKNSDYMGELEDQLISWALRCKYCFNQIAIEKHESLQSCFCPYCFKNVSKLYACEFVYRFLVPVWFTDAECRDRVLYFRIDHLALNRCDPKFRWFKSGVLASLVKKSKLEWKKVQKEIVARAVEVLENCYFLPNKSTVRGHPGDDHGSTILLDVLDCRVLKPKSTITNT